LSLKNLCPFIHGVDERLPLPQEETILPVLYTSTISYSSD